MPIYKVKQHMTGMGSITTALDSITTALEVSAAVNTSEFSAIYIHVDKSFVSGLLAKIKFTAT